MAFESHERGIDINDPDYNKIINGTRVEELGDTFMFATLSFQKYYAEKWIIRDSSNEMMPHKQSLHGTSSDNLSLEQSIEINSEPIRAWLNTIQGRLAIYTYAKGKTMEDILEMKGMEELEQAYISSLH